jgi:hypothetical protein
LDAYSISSYYDGASRTLCENFSLTHPWSPLS